MKRAPAIALLIALVAGLWIASGYYGINLPWAEGVETSPDTASEDMQSAREEPAITRVRVISSLAVPKIKDVELFGRTESDRVVEVSAETSGRIVSIKVIEGSTLSKGDVIVHLSMDGRQARLDEAKAQMEFREISYSAAEKLSKKQFKSEVKLAEEYAALESSKAVFAIAKLDIIRTRIKAPFDGVLEKLPLEVGDYVRIGDPVAIIVDLDPVIVVVEVTEREIAQVQLGQRTMVTLLSGAVHEGTISYISRSASTATRTFRVEIKIENPHFEIPDGMTASVTMMTKAVDAHFISPAIMTLDDRGVLGVKAVDEDNKVIFYPVQLVVDTPEGIWVSGLPDQVLLISVGQEFVREGQRVQAMKSAG